MKQYLLLIMLSNIFKSQNAIKHFLKNTNMNQLNKKIDEFETTFVPTTESIYSSFKSSITQHFDKISAKMEEINNMALSKVYKIESLEYFDREKTKIQKIKNTIIELKQYIDDRMINFDKKFDPILYKKNLFMKNMIDSCMLKNQYLTKIFLKKFKILFLNDKLRETKSSFVKIILYYKKILTQCSIILNNLLFTTKEIIQHTKNIINLLGDSIKQVKLLIMNFGKKDKKMKDIILNITQNMITIGKTMIKMRDSISKKGEILLNKKTIKYRLKSDIKSNNVNKKLI